MNANDIESLKPGPGLTLAEAPETALAVSEIEAAHKPLAQSFHELCRENQARRTEQRLGVDCTSAEVIVWKQWQGGPLRVFHTLRHRVAGRILTALQARVDAEAVEIREREEGVASALVLQQHGSDNGLVVRDLAGMLRKITGGIPPDPKLRSAYNGWAQLVETSRRALAELPGTPAPTPPASEAVENLKRSLENKEDKQ